MFRNNPSTGWWIFTASPTNDPTMGISHLPLREIDIIKKSNENRVRSFTSNDCLCFSSYRQWRKRLKPSKHKQKCFLAQWPFDFRSQKSRTWLFIKSSLILCVKSQLRHTIEQFFISRIKSLIFVYTNDKENCDIKPKHKFIVPREFRFMIFCWYFDPNLAL